MELNNNSLYDRFCRAMAHNYNDFSEVQRILNEQLRLSKKVESTSTGKLETLKTRQDEVNTHISNLYLALRSLLQVSEGQVKRELQNACNEQEEQLRTIQQLAEGEVSLISSSLDFIESQMASMSGNRSLQQKWDCYAHEIKQMLSNQDRKDSDTLKHLAQIDFAENEVYLQIQNLLSSGAMGYLKKSQLSPNQLHLENTSVTQNSAEFFVRCAVGMSLNFCIEREYLSVEVTLNGENHPHTNVGRQTSEGSIAEIKITFDTEAEGNYVVSAQLYGEHIRNSPLNLELKSKLPTNEVSSQFTQGCLSPIAESEVESFVIDFQPRESRPLRPESVYNLNLMAERFERTVDIQSFTDESHRSAINSHASILSPSVFPTHLSTPSFIIPPPPTTIRRPHSRPDCLFPSPITRAIKTAASKERRVPPKPVEPTESKYSHLRRWLGRRHSDQDENVTDRHEEDTSGAYFKRPRRRSNEEADTEDVISAGTASRRSSDEEVQQQTRPDITRFMYIDDKNKQRIQASLVMSLGQKRHNEPIESAFSVPIGCCKNDFTNDFIVCDTGHHVIKLFDAERGIQKRLIGEDLWPRLHRPSAVVVCPDHSCFVTKDNHSLRLFSYDGNHRSNSEVGRKLLRHPYGLTRDSRGKIVTMDVVSETEQYITVVDLRRSDRWYERRRFDCVDKEHFNKTKIRFLDYYNNRLVVADLGAHWGYISTMDGEKIRQFGGSGFFAGKLNTPSGISIDAKGSIIMGDAGNDRVQVFNSDGDYQCNFEFDEPITFPSDLYLTNDNHLMVMNYKDHYVSIFKLIEP